MSLNGRCQGARTDSPPGSGRCGPRSRRRAEARRPHSERRAREARRGLGEDRPQSHRAPRRPARTDDLGGAGRAGVAQPDGLPAPDGARHALPGGGVARGPAGDRPGAPDHRFGRCPDLRLVRRRRHGAAVPGADRGEPSRRPLGAVVPPHRRDRRPGPARRTARATGGSRAARRPDDRPARPRRLRRTHRDRLRRRHGGARCGPGAHRDAAARRRARRPHRGEAPRDLRALPRGAHRAHRRRPHRTA